MKALHFITSTLLITAFIVSGCNKYLDVKPEDKMLEEDVFKSESSIQQTLNGIYAVLATRNLYGANLTGVTIDILAQQYTSNSYHNYATIAQYNYTDDKSMTIFEGIWTNTYNAILNLNVFIKKLQNTGNGAIHNENYRKQLLGEAYGLRAFLHLDMLRLYGPLYGVDSLSAAIPYKVAPTTDITPIMPANQVMDSIMVDLSRAEQLLQLDPVTTTGINPNNMQVDFYASNRNFRMNYYAVKALQARANLYRGNKSAALDAAKVIINANSRFPWILGSTSLNGDSPNRVFYSEVIFGLYDADLHDMNKVYFDKSNAAEANLLQSVRLGAIYDNANDIRYADNASISWWDKSIDQFRKYADIKSTDSIFRNFLPLIRKSEVYYIAAECEPTNTQALVYLNEVYTHRMKNGGTLPVSTNIPNAIKQEYIKEFFGEGQLFFYYKRNNISSLPNGNGVGNLSMSAAQYVVPLPASETTIR